MVRTRGTKPKKQSNAGKNSARSESSQDSAFSSPSQKAPNDSSWKVWLMDFENELATRQIRLDRKFQAGIEALDRQFNLMLGDITHQEANQLATQLIAAEDDMTSLDATLPLTVKKGGPVTSTARKPRPSPPKTTQRQSRARSRLTRTSSLVDVADSTTMGPPTRRVTRSSSQHRDVSVPRTVTRYQTPLNKGERPVMYVTPKVDPYCPMPLKRYARQGEMAISLTGSPLMVTQSITEPNISLPMNNGLEVYSILPTEGPCPSIPDLDNQTRNKLMILRQNLNQILGDN